MKKIRVLVVDDSALMRSLLSSMLQSDPEIEVVGTAPDPIIARDKIKQHNPDVITLDVEMPRMDGLEFLSRLMTLRPIPVIMISSLTQKGADTTMRALELGAVDFVGKPAQDVQEGLRSKQREIIEKVKLASKAKVFARAPSTQAAIPLKPRIGYSSTEKIIAIGASTGGVEAIRTVLASLPADSPAVVITQHMPEGFTASFARRLDSQCALTVVEAEDKMRVLPGHAYIAPGHTHLTLGRSGANYICVVEGRDRVSGHCPSVDVLFNSVAKSAGANAVGAILTGMGRDGAEGLLAMRKSGAHTIGQDQATSVVYGMPRSAHEIGAVTTQLPLGKIAAKILDECCSSSPVRSVRI